MQEFEDIANQIASDLQEQVARVDEFVTANELKLLEEDARIDYMGNQQKSIRKVNEANVDYAVKTAIGEFNYLDYEGQHITATNSIEGHTKSAILKGVTGYKDVDTGEILETFEEGRNLELVSVKMPVLTTCGKNLFDMNRPYDAITDSQATVVQDTNQITVSSANSGTYVSANFILDKDFFAGKTVTGSCLYESDIKDIGTVQINYQDDNGDHHYQWIKTPKTFTFPNNFIGDVMLCVSANNTGTPQSNTVTVKNIQLELGSGVTPYYEPHKSNILTVNEDVELRGIGDVRDELNLMTGEFTNRIGYNIVDGVNLKAVRYYPNDTDYAEFHIRFSELKKNARTLSTFSPSYLKAQRPKNGESFWANDGNGTLGIVIQKTKLPELSIDGLNEYLKSNPIEFYYELETESIKTVVLNDNTVYSYDGVTHYSCSSEEGSLVPTVSLKVPTDVQATITQQRNTIQALESENEALKYGLIEANQYREDGDMDLLSNQWDIDFRLFEIEMALDVPMAVAYKIAKENDSMSRYLQAKTLILGGRYERSKMEYQLKRYLEAGQLTQEEYDELISLMDAREMLA